MNTLLLALGIFYYIIFIEPFLVMAFSKRVQLIVSVLLLLLLSYPTYLLTVPYNFLFISIIMCMYPASLIILRLFKEEVFRKNYRGLLFSSLSFLAIYLLVEERVYTPFVLSYPLLMLLFEIPVFVVIFANDQLPTLMLLESYIVSLIALLLLPYVIPGTPTFVLFVMVILSSVFIFIGKRGMKVKFTILHLYFSIILLEVLASYWFTLYNSNILHTISA
ncbi:hypothetical protein [Stygiolobus caldivivus]|uniref:Uncharacterized protein n=1 Tax=Stygiolobus caldivivus TaxID=2824673 RepID=A0A8D5U3R3_9CREN|nr:hypothetical protein [Stygiolobus caldivivus]BCU68875.1 hypothetical protein KN1_01720 [Stygiolobus caldivivus]